MQNSTSTIKIKRLSNSSWFRLIWKNLVIHIDPGYSGSFEQLDYPLKSLEKADLILVSHNHMDHLQPDVFAYIFQKKTVVVAPPRCMLEQYPYKGIVPGEIVSFHDIQITAVLAYNTDEGRSLKKYHLRGLFVGYLIDLGSRRIYFAGDTDVIPEMAFFGKVDIAFLPIGGTFVMDAEEAKDAIKIIRPKRVIPMHHAMCDLNEFKENIVEDDLAKVDVLYIGDEIEI
ncbi:MAG: MBL fold metallo-hydrolase [Acholeplasmataceae bacterium]|nr:MBL fold metallo-hydrolase [Acholeplasmataceae bacterium]